MPHEVMDIGQVAAYLHMDAREVEKLASRGKVPCRRQGDKYLFRKGDVDHWVEEQLHTLPQERLAQIERGVRRHHGMGEQGVLVAAMIPPDGVAVPLKSKTRKSALKDLVALAETAGMVYDSQKLLAAATEREDLCSTAIMPGVALPHPRHPMPYHIAESFIVVGRTDTGIPFGAPDGTLTRLFFLICCKDDRTHLHVLARLSRMLGFKDTISELLAAPDAAGLRAVLEHAERQAISCPVDR